MKIFFDVDTQNDFMNKDGALYVPEAELIKDNLLMLTNYAKGKYVPILGSVDKHFGTEEYKVYEGELTKWGGPFPDHCMDATEGELKIYETTTRFLDRHDFGNMEFSLPNYLVKNRKFDELVFSAVKSIESIPSSKNRMIKEKVYIPHQGGIFFEKQSYDMFTNPALEIVLKNVNVDEAVVYGVATDYCVKAAVLGMQQRGIQCFVVEDAIKGVFPESTKSALEEMSKSGAKFVTTKQVLGEK